MFIIIFDVDIKAYSYKIKFVYATIDFADEKKTVAQDEEKLLLV